MTTITLNNDDFSILSLNEVADQLMNNRLERNEYIGEVRLECGCDLEVDIHIKNEDPKLNGHLDRTETFTISDIRDDFVAADYYCWAIDENGQDVLMCFGC